jgi:hypothetical protein
MEKRELPRLEAIPRFRGFSIALSAAVIPGSEQQDRAPRRKCRRARPDRSPALFDARLQ